MPTEKMTIPAIMIDGIKYTGLSEAELNPYTKEVMITIPLEINLKDGRILTGSFTCKEDEYIAFCAGGEINDN